MFSALNQGSPIYILDKTDRYKFKIGEVVSRSEPPYPTSTFNQFQPNTIDLKVNIDGTTYEYNQIPSSSSVVTYNNGKITISETKQGLQSEVEAKLNSSESIINNIDFYKQNIEDCKGILKQLNPQYAKDQERDSRLSNLEERFGGVEDRLDKIINMINK